MIAVGWISRGITTGGWNNCNTCAKAAFALSTMICVIGALGTSCSKITAPALHKPMCSTYSPIANVID